MATRYWTGGANNGTFGDANNWNTARDGSGSSGAPAGTDTLFIEQTSQTINGADTGLAFVDVTITFAGNVGSASAPLRFTATGTVKIATTTGTHYIAATSAGTIATVHVAQTGNGKVYLAGPGAITTFRAGANVNVDIAANTAVTTAQTAGGYIAAAANATAFTTLTVGGGYFESARGATTAHISGTLKTTGNAAAITTCNTYRGGFHQNWASSTVGTSTVLPGGKASAKGSPYMPTITDRNTYEGGDNYTDSANVVFTNTATPIGSTA